jgi:hypothetical protein
MLSLLPYLLIWFFLFKKIRRALVVVLVVIIFIVSPLASITFTAFLHEFGDPPFVITSTNFFSKIVKVEKQDKYEQMQIVYYRGKNYFIYESYLYATESDVIKSLGNGKDGEEAVSVVGEDLSHRLVGEASKDNWWPEAWPENALRLVGLNLVREKNVGVYLIDDHFIIGRYGEHFVFPNFLLPLNPPFKAKKEY